MLTERKESNKSCTTHQRPKGKGKEIYENITGKGKKKKKGKYDNKK